MRCGFLRARYGAAESPGPVRHCPDVLVRGLCQHLLREISSLLILFFPVIIEEKLNN